MEGAYADAIVRINAAALPVISVDVPSGISGNGACHGLAVRAAVTVSLVSSAGPGDRRGAGSLRALEWDAIGLPATLFDAVSPSARAVSYAGIPAVRAAWAYRAQGPARACARDRRRAGLRRRRAHGGRGGGTGGRWLRPSRPTPITLPCSPRRRIFMWPVA